MSSEPKRPLDAYLSDLKTVKDLLTRHDEKSMLAPWAFFVWAAVVVVGTVVHAVVAARNVADLNVILRAVWLPVVLVGGLGELLAWLSRMSREDTPLFGRRFMRFVLSAVGVFAAAIPIAAVLLRAGLLSPGVILTLSSIVFLVYAEITFSSLFLESYTLLVVGIVFVAVGVSSFSAYIASGVLLSAAFLAFGIHSVLLERAGGDSTR